jgi:hypothetical protein
MGYRWNGAYGEQGSSGPNGRSTKSSGNKGVARMRREVRREEAEERAANVRRKRTRQFRLGYLGRAIEQGKLTIEPGHRDYNALAPLLAKRHHKTVQANRRNSKG